MKIGLCIPSRGEMHVSFVLTLLNLISHVRNNTEHQLDLFFRVGPNLPDNFEQLVGDAKSSGCTHVLFFEDDTTLIPNAFDIIVSRNKPVVLTNYPQKQFPILFTTGKLNGFTISETIPTTKEKHGLEECDYGGFGFTLIDITVFDKIEKPWFPAIWNEELQMHATPDIAFYRKLKDAGIQVYVDHDVSKLVTHRGALNYSWRMYSK